MALNLQGKTALVTGGGSGICLELVKKLLEGGSNVVVVDLGLRPEAEEVVRHSSSGPVKAKFIKTDVTKWDQLQASFDFTMKEFGRLDIVVPGAGVFEPPWSNFWHFNTGKDTIASSSYQTLEINVTHPIRATQLAIDYFLRQKLGHGIVVIVASIAAQLALMPTPMYAASKHAMSGFTRSLADLEPKLNIRVNAVAPGCVKTPLWTTDKLGWMDEETDAWVPAEKVAQTMIDLITKKENVGGTVLEVGVDLVRPVHELNDPGPSGRGHTVGRLAAVSNDVFSLIAENFGK
ncbi:uncharacterized protein Z519_08799 [Cladophialophora bantiana CBS 173.52]|uniref:NAD-dependent 15-hydroxyprostaglandin dehydrogenase n=1 Tax=Cladophialophora bantiana (strain ATCC 10958 / CBS 173.52 / CDC B-1940 / NIH 8579) TaxID=1442370 RepID=A0A0D2EJD2_CLAB1|nr:uncharacterized protein Z519_08799 [Cladophialophora bantiana CBS 173.52]KIW90156.1 hypothetical protein Z519_08799 [Cladophialophora bantiana CBS 173.52]